MENLHDVKWCWLHKVEPDAWESVNLHITGPVKSHESQNREFLFNTEQKCYLLPCLHVISGSTCYLNSCLIQVYVSHILRKTDLRKTFLISPKYKWLILTSPLPKFLALLLFLWMLETNIFIKDNTKILANISKPICKHNASLLNCSARISVYKTPSYWFPSCILNLAFLKLRFFKK